MHLENCLACSERVADMPIDLDLGEIMKTRSPLGQDDHTDACEKLVKRVLSQTHVLVSSTSLANDATRPKWEPPTPTGYPEIAGYRILSEIHRGGQGVVYKALQVATKRNVALKVPREGPFASEASRLRFEREVALAAQLQHPNIVRVLESGVTHGHQYFAMDFITGRPLDKWLADHPKASVRDRLRLFEAVCRTIHYAHLRGVIHRDLKPSNIVITPDDQPRILDFGLAKPAPTSAAVYTELTQTGQVMGTLPYLSPEQAGGTTTSPDIRSDIYSLGVILYETLTDQPPYPANGSVSETIKHICQKTPQRPSDINQNLDDELDAIVLRCLAKAKDDRYQSAGSLADDIDRYLSGELIEAKQASIPYLLRKTLHRYWIQFAALAAVIVLVTVATVSVSAAVAFTIVLILSSLSALIVWQWRREQQQRRFAEEHANVALAARENERQALLNEKNAAPPRRKRNSTSTGFSKAGCSSSRETSPPPTKSSGANTSNPRTS